ncbi:pimeloyl-ACP methyl ester carboxylesterase [Saccharopolyspora erythraea NRRL 2338]|uniref:Abhydrolase, alpha/beta hydrolase fold n=2 Tax=Saccharopolyspora erythraea TaxID=1836 RepID=A4FG05_SACEN|nr:alpha/beta hydrolase [Saccharopolyspora erythraea]EQD82072.1 alpha/beta hydrolase [Saccharopolyspora erythraea D]PFG96686.1 pimeloyl-ACP methyl ester carboxylesterase [Saccharopolyspora erythraea NRRL 2338]QRK86946.1 alpha/beta hydrolase [Saccharopolyspora erythraea]CAM02980.1 abhydrolase, alpha/beta hydrolase fold [Saccharopolyspora erythraea NRRL 2338]
MTPVKTGTLPVPGATLHHETRGTGPLLLLIPGGSADAAIFGGLATHLADRYTVLTYDPRGFSRSPLHGPVGDQRVQTHSDDAHLLLDALLPPGQTAHVFGTSSGAFVALDLLTRHPDRLGTVIAHEPPAVEILPDAAQHRAMFAHVRQTYREQGTAAAMAALTAGLAPEGQAEPEIPPDAGLPAQRDAMLARMHANLPVFLEHILCQFTAYTPDLPTLRSRAHQLVLAVGQDSRNELPHHTAASLAHHLGTEPVEFPGGHIGIAEHPVPFADRLGETLETTDTTTPDDHHRTGQPANG